MVTPRNLSLFPFQLRRLLPLLLLPPLITHAQSPGYSQQPSPNASFGSEPAVLIAILLGVFFFITVFFLYIHRRRVIIGGNGNTWAINIRFPSTGIDARGLDPTVIESFPTMVYSDVKGLKMDDVALECAVCLCEFEEEDTLTMLPNCSHAFHPECIGMWLTSHHTCPVCRNDLRNPVPDEQGTSTGGSVGEAEREAQVMIRVDEEEGQDVEAELGRMARIHDQVTRSWRSWSARPAVGGSWSMKGSKVWGEDERERFTLRLPENIRNEVMRSGSSLRRSATVMTLRLNGGEESRRMGYREGRSFTRGSSVRAVKSDRWPYLRLSSFKAGDRGPLDRLSGGGRSRRGKSGEDEKSTVALTKH